MHFTLIIKEEVHIAPLGLKYNPQLQSRLNYPLDLSKPCTQHPCTRATPVLTPVASTSVPPLAADSSLPSRGIVSAVALALPAAPPQHANCNLRQLRSELRWRRPCSACPGGVHTASSGAATLLERPVAVPRAPANALPLLRASRAPAVVSSYSHKLQSLRRLTPTSSSQNSRPVPPLGLREGRVGRRGTSREPRRFHPRARQGGRSCSLLTTMSQ